MIVTSLDNIEDEKPRRYNQFPSFSDRITILLLHCSIKLKSFMLNVIAIGMISIIVVAFAVFTFGRNLQLDAGGSAILVLGIKNAMSVPAIVYTADCVARVPMYVALQEIKKEYIDPAFSYTQEIYNYAVSSINHMLGVEEGFFKENDEL